MAHVAYQDSKAKPYTLLGRSERGLGFRGLGFRGLGFRGLAFRDRGLGV